ncbi:adenine nucleotide alpha hydrolase [Psychromarinibacter halotolerans]|uniref:Adenine nucleotide alpha hydrolase n=1 Tax=Psychromarinibacter halotolerans TaxID=1775175 RepID=A0ABV7GYI2_9RHOB|nr:adenine nucleotide alpha hydrolase [Psychromarinibacter halotolerans]MDF0595257.1 adenine nucleotide alpha hydrolase [Psychromarinibacter halotolerans]
MSALARLRTVLSRHDRIAVAVSGGVDSMTLAHVAHGIGGTVMIHAISAAVPAEATARVRRHAAASGWRLRIVDAGEFGDPRYRENPVNRCYFCKQNLYKTIRDLCDGAVMSGTNLDDLGDFRPGLTAAKEQGVVHPYVEARIGKDDVYGLARALGLGDLHRLPAQPCLASRIETDIRVEAADLAFVDAVESGVRRLLGAATVVRCRVTHGGVVLELDGDEGPGATRAATLAQRLCDASDRAFLGARPYRQGAAFLRGTA